MISFSRPRFAEDGRTAVHELVRRVGLSHRYMLGERCREIENDVMSRVGAKYAVTVGNASAALLLALRAVGVGPGDEVIMPAVASSEVASQIIGLGARPVFADVMENGLVIDPCSAAERITRRTRAILPLHVFSCLADMPRIRQLADRNDLAVIEHACGQLSAECHGASAGRWGDVGIFSFSQRDGSCPFVEGAVMVTDNEDVADMCRLLRNHGHHPTQPSKHVALGLNQRMDEIVADLILRDLTSVDRNTHRAHEIAQYYRRQLRDIPEAIIPQNQGSNRSRAHDFVLQSSMRDELKHFLASQGVESRVHFSRTLPQQTAFRSYSNGEHELPESSRAASEHLALPIYPELRDVEVETIAESILAFFKRTSRSLPGLRPTDQGGATGAHREQTAPAHGPSGSA